jgi:hypothetical protein
MVCPALHNFSTLSHKRNDLKKKVIEHKMGVFISYENLSETFLILRRTEGKIIINVQWASCKVPVALLRLW